MSQPSSPLKGIHVKDFEPVDPAVLERLPQSIVRQKLVVPLSLVDERLIVATSETVPPIKTEALALMAHCPVEIVQASKEDILQFIKIHYPLGAMPETPTLDFGASQTSPHLVSGSITVMVPPPPNALPPAGPPVMPKALETVREPEMPPIKPVVAPEITTPSSDWPLCFERLFRSASINQATEIVVERGRDQQTHVRQRIRGVLVRDFQTAWTEAETRAVFDFVETRGELRTINNVRTADYRVERSEAGKAVVVRAVASETGSYSALTVRIRRKTEKAFKPEAWGMGPQQVKVVEEILGRRQGLILFCGEDSDDRDGNIEACGRQLLSSDRHVIQVRFAEEAVLPGVEVLNAGGNETAFDQLLTLAFHHNPDVLLAGPLNTKTSYELCLNEALKGRLVLARSDAQTTSDAVLQMLRADLEPYLVGCGLLGVVAQQSLRLNCVRCAERENLSRDRLKEMGVPVAMQPSSFYRGKGCEVCYQTGFDRETAIFEVLDINEDVRSKFVPGMTTEVLRTAVRAGGLMTFRQVALHKAINGQTSLAEVLRVTP